MGLARPDSGRVLLNGDDITDLPMYLRARSGISYLPQEPSVFRQLTVRRKSARGSGDPAADPGAAARPAGGIVGADGTGNRATQAGPTRCPAASAAAWRSRVRWCWSPPFILLDEPFSGIDPLTVVDIQKIIAELEPRGNRRPDHRSQRARDPAVTDRAYILQQRHESCSPARPAS